MKKKFLNFCFNLVHRRTVFEIPGGGATWGRKNQDGVFFLYFLNDFEGL
jgi:hypothetical protein